MTTPVERVERLREETALATHGPWELGEVFGPYPDEPAIPVHADVEPLIGAGISVPDAAHIARWDPEAATKVLDLLAWVFVWHSVDDPAYPAAMAVLDALDPPEAT